MRKLCGLLLTVVIGAALIGCGGNGGNDGTSGFSDQAVVDSLNRAIHDINTENIDDLADEDLASDFFDDCFDRGDFLAEMQDIFNDPDRDYNFSIDNIVDVDRTSNTEATVTYDFTITDDQGSDVVGTSTDLFVREGGEWRWAGNQECNTVTAANRTANRVWRAALAKK